ncbi:hypothetical protein [Massilia terrae]|uniref:Uncharacterized protein n=1 Tax=Massilia terrae TaxID=1811224 RepID=A0ABT2CSZ3_9BURK|nr:hypothetical protein [Massilia terrae]MCS0656959.1 hypothetical protein [Massilia terrae]
MENTPLDSREATSGARFNKLPVARADVQASKISDLERPGALFWKKEGVLKNGNNCV